MSGWPLRASPSRGPRVIEFVSGCAVRSDSDVVTSTARATPRWADPSRADVGRDAATAMGRAR